MQRGSEEISVVDPKIAMINADWARVLGNTLEDPNLIDDDVMALWQGVLNGWEKDWEVVGGNLLQAMSEVAEQYGGEKLAEEVVFIAKRDGGFPHPEGLRYLIDSVASLGTDEADIGEEVIKRFLIICEQRRQSAVLEMEALRKQFFTTHALAFFEVIKGWLHKRFRRRK